MRVKEYLAYLKSLYLSKNIGIRVENNIYPYIFKSQLPDTCFSKLVDFKHPEIILMLLQQFSIIFLHKILSIQH